MTKNISIDLTSSEKHDIIQSIVERKNKLSERLKELKTLPKSDYKVYEVKYYSGEINRINSLLIKLGYS